MIPLTLTQIAEIVGGAVHDADPATLVDGAAFLDSRAPVLGGLFVALAGDRTDGHAYAGSAVAGGAAAVLGSRPTGVPSVVVDDVTAALQELARTVLLRRRGAEPALTVVAITGSQGKTSAKDMLAQVLADAGATVATYGSFNNELGLPLTVLRTEPDTRYLVLEMGSRGVGHLAELCAIAPPDLSLVLNVGKAHIGEFGSQETIALAKGELVEALTASGTAVLNADDPRVAAMAARTSAAVTTFGTDSAAWVRLGEVDVDDLGRPSFELGHGGRVAQVRLNLLGSHQALNAAAVAAAALAAGCDFDQVVASLRALRRLSQWRMELDERPDGVTVINDAYNANPDSMRAGLETLAGVGARTGRRTVAVLGQMMELGEASETEHAALGSLASRLGVDVLAVVGAGARPIADAFDRDRGGDVAHWFEAVEPATEWLSENVAGPDVVLVKASRSAELERVAESLLAAGNRRQVHDVAAEETDR